MLLLRGIQLLLIGVWSTNGQNYDSEYRPEYEAEDHSSYEGGSDSPDYSKYYSSDSSAPIISNEKSDSGFVSPIDFSGFFGPSHFELGAASNQEVAKTAKQNGFVTPHEFQSGFSEFKSNNPFNARDYFEEAQKQKAEETNGKDIEEVKPGPSYISHKIVPPGKGKQHKYKTESSNLNEDYNYNPYKTVKVSSELKVGDYEEPKKSSPKYEFDFKPLPIQQYPIPTTSVVDPKYLPQYSTNAPQALTPYQKYSFQPAGNSDYTYTPALQNYNNFKYATTSVPNYQYSPSEKVTKLIKHKNCQKVNKQLNGRLKREAMDCYICKDPKNGANYEECSYGSESNPKNYYHESSKKYSQPNIDGYRYKRYTVSDEKDDPYDYVKSKKYNEKYYAEPKDFESQYYQPQKDEEYRFGPEHFSEDEEKSSSERESEELVKNGENCKKEHRDGMVCMVCKNSKTGGNYEQCSYSSQPNEKKYAYVNEKKYDSNDDPQEETESSEDKPIKEEQTYGRKSKGEKARKIEEVEKVKPKSTHRKRPSELRKTKSDYEVPKHFEEHNIQNQQRASATDDHYTEDAPEKPLESPQKNDYYYKFFPEYENEESKQNEQQSEPDGYGYYGEGDKKDVDEVLAEFAKKDRSQCKKAEKNGMTCFLCTDKKGRQHEECMYVSESRPQSKYASYHAKQEDPENQQSQIKPTEVASPKQRRFPKKTTTTTTTSTTHKPIRAQRVTTQIAPTIKPKTRQYRRTKNTKAITPTTEPTIDTPSEEGEYADETRPVYSKVLGFSLPKYMLDKSEGELIYDEFAKSKS